MSSPHSQKTRGVKAAPRVVRLITSVGFILTGLAFIVWPSKVATDYFETSIPSYAVGAMLVLGGAFCTAAWKTHRLSLDRAGLSALVAGLGVVSVAQTLAFFEFPISWPRLAGAIGLWTLTLVLVARWQDVKHQEQVADEAVAAAQALDEKEQRSDGLR